MASSHPLDRWADGIRAGNDDAFAAVYHDTVGDLTSFAFGLLGSRGAAEDVVQDSFIELVRSSRGIRGEGRSIRVWLFRCVRFRSLDELRRRKLHAIPTDALPEIPHLDHQLDEIDSGLEEALNKLSDRHRTLLILHHVAGLSGQEVAEVMRSSRGAVYAAIARAERRLRQLMEETE